MSCKHHKDGIYFAYLWPSPTWNSLVPDSDEEAIALVAREIKRYLDAHPNATDSLRGITRWWLARQRFETATEIVQRALEHLVAEGELIKDRNGGRENLVLPYQGQAVTSEELQSLLINLTINCAINPPQSVLKQD
ncbi:MAG: winged helix DNA-binding domain-containing protein [Nitrococcus sp.]|nr:winged helix DNA-binding domain-containing protein [Nitrococcus sp.]